MAEETVEQLQKIIHAELNSDNKENFNFALLKKWVDGKSDGAALHFYTQDNGLILSKGCTDATLAVVDLKDAQLVVVNAHFDKSITSNKWTDSFRAPTSIFHDYYAKNDYFEEMDGRSKVHIHILFNPQEGTFPVFVYGNEAGGLQDYMYTERVFFIQK